MTTAVHINPRVKMVQDINGAVLLNLETGTYYSINRVGSDIWSRLSQPANPTEVIAELSAQFALAPERFETDFWRFVDSLEGAGLIHVERQ